MFFNTLNMGHLLQSTPQSYMKPTSFDPLAMMIQRKNERENPEAPKEAEPFKNEDVKEFEDFCKKHGIIGFGCKGMSPKTALRMLKNKMGLIEEPKTVISERTLLKG